MTYQNTTEQFAASGHSIATTLATTARRSLQMVGKVFGGIWDSMMKSADAASRAPQIEALQAKSDAELAKMGIKRENIVHHVFRDLFYC